MAPVIRGNSLYTIVDGPSWTQAEANSVKLGGHLVAINSSEENTFIWQEFSNIQKYMVQAHGDAPGIFSHWIGLTDAKQEGTWVWTTGQSMTYVNTPFTNQEGTYRTDENYTRVTWNVPASWTGGIETKGFWQDTDTQQYYNGIFYTPTGIAETPFVQRGNSAYVIVQGPTWEEAEENAVKLGGHLVTINDAEENEWIKSNFSSYKSVSSGGADFWIGLTDKATEGQYKWVDGTPFAYSGFYNGGVGDNGSQNGMGNYPTYDPPYTSGNWWLGKQLTFDRSIGEDYGLINAPSGNWNDLPNNHRDGSVGIAEIKLSIPTPTYTLTPSTTSINEGSTLTTSITTTDVASGTTLYYSLSGTGITATDFSSGALTGSGTVGSDGSFSFSHTLANDLTTEGSETLQVKLFSDASRLQQVGSTASLSIADTSKATNKYVLRGNSLYTIANDTSGGRGANGWLSARSNAQALGGDLVVFETREEQQDILKLLETLPGGEQGLAIGMLVTGGSPRWVNGLNLTYQHWGNWNPTNVLDGYVGMLASYYGGNERYWDASRNGDWGWNGLAEIPLSNFSVTPSASSINEGSTLTTTVATISGLSGTTLYYSLSGSGITATDFSSGALTGSGIVGSDGTFTFTNTLANDLTTEGTETLNIKLFSDSARSMQVGSTASVSIADTSKAVLYIEINKVANHPEIPWWWHNMNENASTVEGTQEFNVVHYECRNAINVNTTLLKVGNITTVVMDSGNSSVWGADSLDKNVEGFSVISGNGDDQVTIKLGTDRGESNFSHLELRLFSGRDSVYIDRISLLDNAVTGGSFIDGGDGIDTVTINDTYDNYKLYSSNPIDRNRWELGENRVYRNRFLSSYNSGFTFPDNLRFSDQPAYPQISLFDIEKIIFLDREVLLEKTLPTYTLTPSATSINEGSTLITTVTTTNVASGTTLYYSLSGSGITATDFSAGSLTGSGTVSSNGSFSFSHTLANDLTTEATETLNIKLFSDASRLQQTGSTASVSIADTSTTLGTPTARTVDNLYAKALIAGPLVQTNITGVQINYQFYNIGSGRYGIRQKESAKIDEITGLASISISGTTISISQDIQGVFDQVTGMETQDAQAFRIYNAAFARFPDSSGLRYWINEYKSGISNYRTIAQSFINSNEFALRYGANNSNEEFINNMYKNVLGRLPDASGLAYWVGNLNSGADSRVNVLGGFSESAENKILFSQGTGFI